MVEPELAPAPRRLDKKSEDNALLFRIRRSGGQSLGYVFGNAHLVGFLVSLPPANDDRISVSAMMFFRL